MPLERKEPPWAAWGTEIAALFSKIGLDAEIPELRGHEIKLWV
jgi:hypothetical protein